MAHAPPATHPHQPPPSSTESHRLESSAIRTPAPSRNFVSVPGASALPGDFCGQSPPVKVPPPAMVPRPPQGRHWDIRCSPPLTPNTKAATLDARPLVKPPPAHVLAAQQAASASTAAPPSRTQAAKPAHSYTGTDPSYTDMQAIAPIKGYPPAIRNPPKTKAADFAASEPKWKQQYIR